MSFIETPRFPDIIAYGSSGGPEYRTRIAENEDGKETRNNRRQTPKHKYNVGVGANTSEKLALLRDYFHAMLGRRNGFRFKDFNDYSTASHMGLAVTATDHILVGTVDGVNDEFQLVKRYTVGSLELVRTIKKPVAGTILISIDDVTESPSNYTEDTTTGIITFNTPPSIGEVVKGGCQFDVPVRFTSDSLQVDMISYNVERATMGVVEDFNA